MEEPIRWAAAALPPLLLGGGLALLLAPRGSRLTGGRLFAWSILLGAPALALLQSACTALARGPALRTMVVALGLGVAGAGVLWARRRHVVVRFARPRGRRDWLLLAALAVEVASLAAVAFRTRLGWNALAALETQARPAWVAETAPPAATEAARRARVELMPALEAWCFGQLGRVDQRVPKALLLAFLVAVAALIASAAREDDAWVPVPLLIAAVPRLVVGPGSATSGDADFVLAALYLACVMSLLGDDERGGGRWRLAALAASLLLVAPAGPALWLSVVGIAAWRAGADRLRVASIVAAPGIVLLLVAGRALPHAPPHAFGAAPLLSALLDLSGWGLLWVLLPLALPRFLPVEMRPDQQRRWAAIVAPLAIQAVLAAVRRSAPLDAVLIPVAMPALLALAAAAAAHVRRTAASVDSRPSRVPAVAMALAVFALPGLEQTARAVNDAALPAAGAFATTDSLLAPLGMPSPTAAVRAAIAAVPPRAAVLYLGAARSAREVGRALALLAAPRPFAGWICPAGGAAARPLRARQAGPETDGVVLVYRPLPDWPDWMPLRLGASLWVVPPEERYRVSPPPALCQPAVTRGQAALLLSRARHRDGGEAPAARGLFEDVPEDEGMAAAAEELAASGATRGCAPRRFCPDEPVTRAQMVLFALAGPRAAAAPAAEGLFADVPATHPLAALIERAYHLGVPGCADRPPRFCPDRPVRAPDLAPFLALVEVSPSGPPR